jgi:hypothetical protein
VLCDFGGMSSVEKVSFMWSDVEFGRGSNQFCEERKTPVFEVLIGFCENTAPNRNTPSVQLEALVAAWNIVEAEQSAEQLHCVAVRGAPRAFYQ